MKLLVNLGIFLTLIIFSTCDDCSSIITESSCTGSCQWTAGKEATCTASISCSINSGITEGEPEESYSFTTAVKTDPTCMVKSAEDDTPQGYAAAGNTYDTSNIVCNVSSCAVSGDGCSSEGCEFIASTVTTPASYEGTTTWQLNSDKTACETSDGYKFITFTAGTYAEKSIILCYTYI